MLQNKNAQTRRVVPLKVSYSYSFGFDRLQKMQILLWENV